MIRELTFLGLSISTYSLMAYIAAVTCAAMSWKPLRRCGLPRAGIIILLSLMCVAFLVGARLWNVVVNPDSYGENLHWYTFRMKGFSMYGGIFGSFIVIPVVALITRTDLVKILDALTIPAAVAFCIARVGCFLNGCCAGKITDLPWGVHFPSSNDSALETLVTVHPTQLYELALALIGVPLCLWLVKLFRSGAGGRFFIYGVWFSTMRLVVLPFRSLSYSLLVRELIYPLIYYVLIVIGIFLFVWSCRKERAENSGKAAG